MDYKIAPKVICKSCGKEFELDEPVRFLRNPRSLLQVSTSKTTETCPYCCKESEYSSNDVTNVIEPTEE